MNTIKSIYGKVILFKLHCKHCKRISIMIDNEFQCCGRKNNDILDKEIIKREIEGEKTRSYISKEIKKEILLNQNGKCIYCDISFKDSFYYNKNKTKIFKIKIHYDHFTPWVYSKNNEKSNLYASCNICNSLKGCKHFNSLEQAIEYLKIKRERKNINERMFVL